MKKIFFFLSAIALLGLTAACVEQQPVNPNYDAATNSVKTAFTFNIAATSPQTKSTAATAQYVASGVPTFRGMTDMTLFAYAQGNATTETDFTAGTMYNLGTLDAGVIGNTEEKPSHKIYPLSIPVGTDRMVFYAKAKRANNDTDVEVGKTIFPAANAWTSKNAVEFSLSPRLSGAATTFTEPAAAIAKALNDILDTEFDYSFTPDGATEQVSTATWKALVAHAKMPAKFINFKEVYEAVVPNNGISDIRAGSGPAVLRVASDIYKAMTVIKTNSTDRDVQNLADAIITSITGGTSPNFSLDDSNQLKWVNDTYSSFPTNLNLPAGAAQLTYKNNAFSPADPILDPGNSGSAVEVKNFMYPAELCYWSASKINVTDVDKTEGEYPKTTSSWDNHGENSPWSDWTIDGIVKASTKAVAMKNNIHYGTALLKTTVQYVLTDSKLDLIDSNEEPVTVDAATDIQLTGVLVGKQAQTMGWNWIRKEADNNGFDKIVYDNAIPNGNIPINGDKSADNYTLLFDSNGANNAQDRFVLVALEFKNNTGKDFMGLNNLIPKDGTFYLVGKLDLTDNNGDPLEVALPTGDYAIPGNNTYRAFIQDYVTNANFKIGKESLKKAYYTVPDLRSTQMTFGLSVDLMWKTGHSFDVTFE